MPPRQFENRSLEPSSRRWSFLDEEKAKQEQLPEKTKETAAKKDKKNPDQPATKKEKIKSEKSNPKELSLEEKQEKRNEAIERSRALKNTFNEKVLPRDSSTVARLIIAERIIGIDERLHSPEGFDDAKAKQELEVTLDYMCELAEKLETPTLESSPHIQEAYETLLALTEKALEASGSPTELITDLTETLQTSPIKGDGLDEPATPSTLPDFDTPASPATRPQLKSLATTKLLAYIHNSSPRVISRPDYTSSGGGKASSSVADVPIDLYSSRSPYHASTPTVESLPAKIHDASEYHTTARPSTTLPLASVALASVAATTFHKMPQISHRHESTQLLPAKERTDLTEPLASYHGRKRHTETRSTPSTEGPNNSIDTKHSFTSYTVEATPATGKLEHLPLLSLLALAKDVNVGHGRYLKDEFEHGRIDKAGLIKVLKSKKKGLDFSREFNYQTENFRKRLESIEFITKPPKPSVPNDIRGEVTTHPLSPEPATSGTQKETPLHPIFTRYAHPEKSLFQPSHPASMPTNLIITILGIIIFGALIIFILTSA